MLNTLVVTVGSSLCRHPDFHSKSLLSKLLACEDPKNDKTVGAEINSIVSLVDSKQIQERKFFIMHLNVLFDLSNLPTLLTVYLIYCLFKKRMNRE
ncbi:hypothetical protein DU53_02525 [Kosmotoga sp. DU53]|nr:hypothetical protein DU53_02525 [Kosmotoga sp. DU53]